ncbi:MAG TPA: phosphotransferase [Verrucomicrobiae bacterium]|nr:phosphotransferase [Verrucomicrobiae bacterium]
MSINVKSAEPADPMQTFLWFAGWPQAKVTPLAGDASQRRYFRVVQGSRTGVLMDASSCPSSVPPFVRMDEHLRRLGFSAPKILARDVPRGWLLLEDFGDRTFAQLLDSGAEPRELFELATDLLISLHRNSDAVPAGLRVYSPEQMLHDIELFLEWRTPGIPAAEQEEFRRAWSEVLPLAHAAPQSLLLRDYHVANLMLLPESAGVQRVGLLDFQDAYAGPVTYDLVSLLEDARRELPPGLREEMLARYRDAFPGLERDAFDQSVAIAAAQRHTRVLAIFERLSRKEQKHQYKESHSARVERRLQTALQHPTLAPVRTWMNRHGTAH